MNRCLFLLKLSRPRFWLYLAGPVLVAVAATKQNPNEFLQVDWLPLFFVFLLPANFFLYAWNDWHDRETDKLNPKKSLQETRLTASTERWLTWSLAISAMLLLITLLFLPNWTARIVMLLFLFLCWSYSAPPLRFKARPFWDSYSNVLYILPGVITYASFTNSLPPWPVILWGGVWSVAMHAFSAIPDIEFDRQTKIATVATTLGKQRTLLFVSAHWAIFSVLSIWLAGPLGLLTLIYPLAPLTMWSDSLAQIREKYWYFPWLNAAFGFGIFWWLLISRMIVV